MNEYFSAQDVLEFTFYRIPKALVTDKAYRNVPTEAKLLYGLLLDRMGLSLCNGWLDRHGRVYIFYTIAAIREDLNCSKEKACKLLRNLEQADLVERKRQGLGQPNRIYVKRFLQRSDNPTSGGPVFRP